MGGGQTAYTNIAGMGAKVRGMASAMVIIQESLAAITTSELRFILVSGGADWNRNG
jgi:hypothetical protein